MSQSQWPTSTVAEAAERPAGAVLLDVREDDEWAEARVPEAVHIPIRRLTPDNLPQGRPVYCIFRSGSARVMEVLTDAEIDARNVAGGMHAWVAAGLPVTS